MLIENSHAIQISIPVMAWQAWMPGVETTEEWRSFLAGDLPKPDCAPISPDVSFIDALTRRRLSPYTRMGLSLLHQLVENQSYPIVFASRHGDVNKTVKLLEALAANEILSPTAFGLSVHNAVVGLWAIIKGSKSQNLAIAAGEHSFVQGLIETYSRVVSLKQPHVFVFVEDVVPDLYRPYLPEAQFAHAFALLCHPDAQNHLLVTEPFEAPAQRVSTRPQTFSAVSALLNVDTDFEWAGASRSWQFTYRSVHG